MCVIFGFHHFVFLCLLNLHVSLAQICLGWHSEENRVKFRHKHSSI